MLAPASAAASSAVRPGSLVEDGALLQGPDHGAQPLAHRLGPGARGGVRVGGRAVLGGGAGPADEQRLLASAARAERPDLEPDGDHRDHDQQRDHDQAGVPAGRDAGDAVEQPAGLLDQPADSRSSSPGPASR